MEITSLPSIMLFFGAYLLGSFSAAIILSRLSGMQDPRSYGSGNPGATNVLRSGNKKMAASVLIGDLLKGLFAVLIAKTLTDSSAMIALVGLFAFLGHLYPIFFGFKGGKGVATALGVLLAIHWTLGLATAATWMVTVKLTRISSISALTASLLTPLYGWFLTDRATFYVLCILSALLIWRHRANIQRLFLGEEK